ncbi:zinc finger CCCH domain-containing protein 13-like [Haliotis cracherodii]|uniref:zinc finger CCCH domain-containing protein 13-like n=1 Tax=Haliotis cracherodii TaxID=6455 RepID=UPI0039EC68CC
MAARSDSIGPDSVLQEELDVLRAIYIHELTIDDGESGQPSVLHLNLHPATGDDVTKQFVCMTLVFKLSEVYPDEVPEIIIKNPRGLAEEEVQRLQEDMHDLAEERTGGAMLYELIEMAKEILTEGNIPRCPCVVCLEHFHEGDMFTRTDCYHYFHMACLARYVEHALAQEPDVKVMHLNNERQQPKVVCPVCRDEITFDLDELKEAPAADADAVHYTPSSAMVQLQRDMADLYAKQKAKGGIIDLEAEKNRFLVNEETVVNLKVEKENTDENEHEKQAKDADSKSEKTKSDHRHRQNDRIVAKYKGHPRRDRPNSGYQGRKSPNSEHMNSTTESKQKGGDNSQKVDRVTSHVSEKKSHDVGRRERDINFGRERRKEYYGGRDRDKWRRRNDGEENQRGGSGRDQRDGRRFEGYQRNIDRERREKGRNDHSEVKKDAFDHSEMLNQVENVEKNHSKPTRKRFVRNGNRNSNNANEMDSVVNNGEIPLGKERPSEDRVVSPESESGMGTQTKTERRGQNYKDRTRMENGEYRKSSPRDWSREAGDGFSRGRHHPQGRDIDHSENWEEERTDLGGSATRGKQESDREETFKNESQERGHAESGERIYKSSHSESRNHEGADVEISDGKAPRSQQRKDHRRRDGPRQDGQRREEFEEEQTYSNRSYGKANWRGDRYYSSKPSQGRNWTRGKADSDGQGQGHQDQRGQGSSTTENWDNERIHVPKSANHDYKGSKAGTTFSRGRGQGRGGHSRSGRGRARAKDEENDGNKGMNVCNEFKKDKRYERKEFPRTKDHHENSESSKENSNPPNLENMSKVQGPPPGINSPPGIHIKGPPPGFNASSDNAKVSIEQTSPINPPPGFDFR